MSVVVLGSKSRIGLWLLVVILESSSAVLLALWAAMYFTHNTRSSLLWVLKVYVLFSEAYHFLDRYAYAIASGYALLSAMFAYRVIRLIVVSVRHRQLRFGLTMRSEINPIAHDGRALSVPFRTKRLIDRFLEQVSVKGPYFEARLILDEVLETTFQILAAFSSSRSISNVPLNLTYGAVILISSLSTPFFQRLYHSPANLVKQRTARLLTDLVTDFVWGTLLPVWMYRPILATYFKQKDHGDSIDFTENSAREVERVLVLSGWNYVLSIVPFCNSLLNLIEVRALLRESFDTTKQHRRMVRTNTLLSLQSTIPESFHRSTDSFRTRMHDAHPWWHRVVHAIITSAGVGVFITSLVANDVFRLLPRANEYGCVHRVHPWFTMKEACIGRKFSCSSLGVRGSIEELDAALGAFDTSTLADLFVSDCTALNLSTSSLRHFRYLQSLLITNCTILSWEKGVAALSHDAFPGMLTVKLESVTIDLPLTDVALFTTPLSRSVEWVYISNTNMREALLDTRLVGDHWQHLIYFDCASCSLTAFPSQVVESMGRLIMLSLIDNDIPQIPNSWPSSNLEVVMVWFDNNPQIQQLPDALWAQAGTSLQSVYAQNTNLTSLPPWLPEKVASKAVFEVYAFSTPFCRESIPADADLKFVSCEFQEL